MLRIGLLFVAALPVALLWAGSVRLEGQVAEWQAKALEERNLRLSCQAAAFDILKDRSNDALVDNLTPDELRDLGLSTGFVQPDSAD